MMTRSLRLCLFLCLCTSVRAQTVSLEARQFQFPGDWTVTETGDGSGGGCLYSGPRSAALPAATAVDIPNAGKYYLWVRAMDFPNDRPGTRTFSVSVGGRKSSRIFGTSGKPGFSWEPGGAFSLPKGPVLIGIQSLAGYARADAVVLTTDADFVPSGAVGAVAARPLQLPVSGAADPLTTDTVTNIGTTPLAALENEFLRIEFLPAERSGKQTVCLRISTRTGPGWTTVATDPSAEMYNVVAAGADTRLGYSGFYPVWQGSRVSRDLVTAKAGGVQIQTAGPVSPVIWNAGQLLRCVPSAVSTGNGEVRLAFYPCASGTLSAVWALRPGEHTARVRLGFTPSTVGQFALGYHLFFRRALPGVDNLLLPPMWMQHRFPDQPRTLLDPFTPTPVALVQTTEEAQPMVWGLMGDPSDLPFQWPGAASPHFGLMIRDNTGLVQPSIYGPVPGAAQAPSFSFRVLVQPGDWYAGYRTAADEVFRWRDYRRNTGVSLTDAALNMIDLVMDDTHGGWWDQAKAFYQIESKNGSSEVSPLTLLSLYRLTGDTDLYRRRTLPTMEFTLSRSGAHFSPLPSDTGPYEAGSMNGPVKQFGTAVYGGMAQMTQQRTPAFASLALPDTGVRLSGPGNHLQPFDEWLARYELTGDHGALVRACALADAYLEENIQHPPDKDLGAWAFFFVSAVPDWQGLLRLYEATGKKQYLQGAIAGARWLMTGVWTQPTPPPGDITVHPGGEFPGDNYNGWKGPAKYRLGSPRKPGDTPEHEVPAWLVSNVGLSFEQPITLEGSMGTDRMIYQMVWAPDFLRLTQYTGDKTFEAYARNAVIGRWGNYPGYYATGFTDLPLNPRYPIVGPDVTDIYYHHILPHLAWTIDYLVSEAFQKSGGRIHFPSLRQDGYVYFDTRLYGQAPGQIYDVPNAWLWLRRGLVSIDDPQLNYLTAHNDHQFFLILMNENEQEENTTVRFLADLVDQSTVVPLHNGVAGPPLTLQNGATQVSVPPRGMVVLQLDHVQIDVPAHRQWPVPKAGAHPGYLTLRAGDSLTVGAAALQMAPGPWEAYVWCSAMPGQANAVSLHYNTGDGWHQVDAAGYPFEFSVPVREGQMTFRFFVQGTGPDGKAFSTPESVIGVGP